MAQRVFLVQMPVAELASAAAAICGAAEARSAAAERMAEHARAHHHRVAASEGMIAAAEAATPALAESEAWGHGRSCMPYLISTRNADDTVKRVAAISATEGEEALEDLFAEEARALGAAPVRTAGPSCGCPSREPVAGRSRAWQFPDTDPKQG